MRWPPGWSCCCSGSDLVIDGVRRFSFGFYPKAGPLEAVHIAQTTALVLRSLWLLHAGQRHAAAEKRRRLQLCLCGVALYALSAADYAVNYGLAPYPPGVVFIAGSPVILAFAILKLDLMRPYALAATVAHEVRTPLATIRLQAAEIARAWPDLLHGYRLAVDHGLCAPPAHPAMLERLPGLAGAIAAEVASAHSVIDMALASGHAGAAGPADLRPPLAARLRGHGPRPLSVPVRRARARAGAGVQRRLALRRLRYAADARAVQSLEERALRHPDRPQGPHRDFRLAGRRQLRAGYPRQRHGHPASVQRRIFDPFFSTKLADQGTGVGLTFCRRVVETFGGHIQCESVVDEYTLFTLHLPRQAAA